MSLKSLEGFIEIYLNSTELIRSAGSVTEQRNLAMIRNSSVAMLIENGLSYRLTPGQISIRTEEREESFPIGDIFIYMSDMWKERIRCEAEAASSVRAMIPAPKDDNAEGSTSSFYGDKTLEGEAEEKKTEEGAGKNASSVEVFTGDVEDVETDLTELSPERKEEAVLREERTKIAKDDMTFEFSQIKVTDRKTGRSETMVMIAFPMFNEESPYIVVNLARQGCDPVIRCGEEISFPYGDTEIIVKRGREEEFACTCRIKDEEYILTRVKTKRGGKGGHFVIYDEGLELHAYPLSTRNVPEEAPFVYYMVIDGYAYLSGTKLYEPLFTYRGKNYRMSLRWLKEEEAALLGVVESMR